MTKKHFVMIAHTLKTIRERDGATPDTQATCDAIAKRLAGEMATLNSLFDRERFLTACGVTE